jgi:hypothetical protein
MVSLNFSSISHITHWRLNADLTRSLKFRGRRDEGCRVGWRKRRSVKVGIEEGKEEDKIRRKGNLFTRKKSEAL